MKKILLVFVLLLTVAISSVSAQSRMLKGKVISEANKNPIAGATVLIQGTSGGAIADINGEFEIQNVNGAVILDITFIGFEQKIISVPATQTTVIVELADSSLAMSDVIVTGYGNYTKQSFTGAADNIDMTEMEDVPALSIEGKLAGGVAGVIVSSNQASPGSVASITIRGKGSINASSNPLYVIDGVPMSTGDGGSFDVGGGGASMLATINPSDIESMTVIKDAAAASLYGSRAANGVIVITTKQGKAGKAKVSLKANWGMSDMSVDFRPQLSGPDRAELLYLGEYNYQTIDSGVTPEAAKEVAKELIDEYAAEPWSGWTDWNDLIYRTGFYQNYEASISGGTEDIKYFSSLSYVDQEGLTQNQAFDRITGRLNVTAKKGRFTFTGSALFSLSNQSVDYTDTGTFGWATPVCSAAWYAGPSQYPYRDMTEGSTRNHPGDVGKGKYSNWFPGMGNLNPLEQSQYDQYLTGFNRTMVSTSVAFNIMDGLDIKETLSYDIFNENSSLWTDPRSSSGAASGGTREMYSSRDSKLNSQTHLTYNKVFSDKHNLNLLAGYEIEDNNKNRLYGKGQGFLSPFLNEIKNATLTEGSWSEINRDRLVSFVGKADYSYDGKYYASASYRRDGSSRLAPDTRWGNFWSASGSWVLSNEKFVEPIKDVLTLAKIRASYGVNGTLPWELYGYMGLYEFGYMYNGEQGIDLSQVYNSGLSWENSYSTNIGLDISLWNRLNVTVDVYQRDTKDLLIEQKVSLTTGFEDILTNMGAMTNRGIELAINGDIIQNSDLQWNLGLTLAHNKNEVVALDDTGAPLVQYNAYIRQIGSPYSTFYTKEFAGINTENGEAEYYENEPIYKGTGEDRVLTGYSDELVSYEEANQRASDIQADPTVTGGLSSSFAWKGIDFSFMFTFSLGGHLYDRINYQFSTGAYLYTGAIPVYHDIDKMWKNPGDVAELPIFKSNRTSDSDSDVHIYSSDHLRLKNVTLGYSLPRSWTNKVGIERLRVYASGANLLTFKDKDCVVDPEMTGSVHFQMPSYKTVTFGIDITF